MTEAKKSLTAWLDRRGWNVDNFVFPSRVDYRVHMSTRQYARLIDEWLTTVGLDKREYGTHSMRRTKVSLIYKATGNLRAVQILLGLSNIANTVRYLGVDIDDALTLSERTEI
jgi:site-specific recombinase XerC